MRRPVQLLIALPLVVHLSGAFTTGPSLRQRYQGTKPSFRLSALSDDGANISDYTMWDPNEPQANGVPKRPNKADIYSMDELQTILDLHNNLSENEAFGSSSSSSSSSSNVSDEIMPLPGLHEMVLQALEEEEPEKPMTTDDITDVGGLSSRKDEISDELKQKIPKIRAIASDVDGTLLQGNQDLHPITKAAVEKAIAAAASPVRSLQYFFPATGKTRKGALYSCGPEIGGLLSQLPGAFLQGLYCVNATGHVIYENKLESEDLIAEVEEMVHEEGLTLLGNDGDTIHTTRVSAERNPHHLKEIHDEWGEDEPVPVETLQGYKNGYHKILMMADSSQQIVAFRPRLQAVADKYGYMTTVSVPTMLEVLPGGSGKGVGVAKLCEALGIDMGTELLAMGDGENDLDFLNKAAIGVAMGNAQDILKQSDGTDFVLKETNNEGGAGIAMELFGFGKALLEDDDQ